jgi:hypothetical protein
MAAIREVMTEKLVPVKEGASPSPRPSNSTGAGALKGTYCKQKPAAQGPPGKPGPYVGWMFLYRRFSLRAALR